MGNQQSIKPLVIYHGGGCADGFGAAFAAWLKFGDEAEYLPMDYGAKDWDHTACYGRDVYILDFSFPRAVMDDLFRHANRVVWLDHHKTAFEMWCDSYEGGMPVKPYLGEREFCQMWPIGGHYILLNNSKSGAMLAWEYFHPDTKVPMLIRHIDDYDRWQFEIPGTKAIARALRQHDFTFENFRHFKDSLHHHGNACYLYTEGGAILRAHDQNVQTALKQARKCHIPNFNVDADIVADHREGWELPYEQALVEMAETHAFPGLAANAPAFLASDLGHELALKSGTFGLVWSVASDLRVHCSLRSNGDYDVSAIAKAFGGGGHRNAAGFSTDIDTLLEWLK